MYEFNSSLILCANAGVNRLHVAGSLRRSYTDDGKVSYTERFDAKVRRLGTVAERCANVGGFGENTADKTGADEFEWLNIVFSVCGDGFESEESVAEPDRNERGGRDRMAEEEGEGC